MGGKLREGTTAPKRRKQITDWELWSLASGTFLLRPLPEDFNDREDREQYKWLSANAWGPFQDYTGGQIWEFIDNLAMVTKQFLNSKNIEVKETMRV